MNALELLREAEAALWAAKTPAEVEALRVKYLGAKGVLTAMLKELGKLPAAERPAAGKDLNEAKGRIAAMVAQAGARLASADLDRRMKNETCDVTLSGRAVPIGRLHPLTQVMREIVDIFARMGFDVAEGPEIEFEDYNFEKLNIPKHHPARDMQATFFINDDVVLRTHTSPVQIRTMLEKKPPVKIVAPGKVYRCDSDISHTPMFHQVEGLLVDRGVSFSDLKGTLMAFVHAFYGPRTKTRFRPSYFPFTEPSAEVDIECVTCRGAGCRSCKGSGWTEILGSGMVHPQVLKNVGYDPEMYTGFAFGMGVERIARLRYGIDDLRRFFENDVRFLRQF
ncbi:MAG: phenylalanine--tRNA ligase subunit alpha [Deltaproteobacteria bacterium]|nr:phenylalanine--tRNA ligase subunit alpha [Deltaproteobacteria bacterium]